MLNFIFALFLGWPAILLTLILITVGLIRRDYRFLVAGAILSFPFSLSIGGFPALSFPAFCNSFLPLLLFASGFLMHRGREMFAWIMAIPFYLVIILLWFAVQAGGV
jgi:hypothetical protein